MSTFEGEKGERVGDRRGYALLAHETIFEGHFREILDRHGAIFLQGINVSENTCDVP